MRTPTASDIRTWAHEQGITVSERGRLSQDVLAAYVKAHNGSVGTDKTRSASAKSKPASTRRTTAVKASRAAAARPTLVGDPQEQATSDGASTRRAKALEQRVAELEKQVLSLTERLDAAATVLTTRSRSFSLPRRR